MFNPREYLLNQRSLAYAEGPASGPPLLLLHGVTRRWQDFAPLLPYLSQRWQVFGLSFRGHGGSAFAPGRYLVRDYIEDAQAILQHVISAPAVVLGHSLGALVAAGLAARCGERVRAVILEDPPSHRLIPRIRDTAFFAIFSGMQRLAGKNQSIAETARLLSRIELPQGEGKPPVLFGDIRHATSVRFSARCLQDLDPEVLTPVLEGRWQDSYDWMETVRGVRCPALLLCGEPLQGGMLPWPEAQEAAAQMHDVSLVQVPGTGHLLHWLATEATIRYVLGFLESLP